MIPFRQILPMIALCLFALSNSAINANFVAAPKQIERGTDNVHHFAIGQRVIRMRRHDEQNILNDDSNGVGEASSDGMMPTTTNEPETTTIESSTQATTMEVSTDTPTTLTTESSSVDLSSSTEKNGNGTNGNGPETIHDHARFLIAGFFAFMTIIFLILLILTACGVICAKSVEEEVDADG